MTDSPSSPPRKKLRYGWTTGACALAAAKAAYVLLLTGKAPDPVCITLPKGQQPCFALAESLLGDGFAQVAIEKDAGDDPDVTHGALIVVRVSRAGAYGDIRFKAGTGVGTVTLPGLPLEVGEPAINPAPRTMIRACLNDIAASHQETDGVEVEISVPGGDKLAKHTWNGRLGIKGGISILGTTGIVVPYSCSAWIHSIHRGVDVARANKFAHVGACVGSTSEKMLLSLYPLKEEALIDMGDFVGGMLKYIRRHPVPFISIAGGFGKISKLACGALDLHSKRSQVDINWLTSQLKDVGAPENALKEAQAAHTALELYTISQRLGLSRRLANRVAESALATVKKTLKNAPTDVQILISERSGSLAGRSKERPKS